MLVDKISKEEKNKILSYIKKYGSTSPSLDGKLDFTSRLELTKILHEWSRNKGEGLAAMFGDNLILEKKIKVQSVSEAEVSRMVLDLKVSFSNLYTFIYSLYERVCSEYEASLCTSDSAAENKDFFGHLKSCICSPNAILNNKFQWSDYAPEREYTLILPEKGKKVKFPTSAKLGRVLSKVCKHFGGEHMTKLFEKWREKVSIYISKTFAEGTLCLSIHPLDYMTMSDNNSGWSSCMSWRKNGCHRGGTLEVMNSPCAVVAYLKNTKDMSLLEKNSEANGEKDSWNSKAWRSLIIVHKAGIFNGKSYPYFNDALSRIAVEWAKEIAEKHYGKGYFEDNVVSFNTESNSFKSYMSVKVNDKTIHVEFYTKHSMYNDFNNSDFAVFAAFKKGLEDKTEISIRFSDAAHCLACQKELVCDSRDLLCDECNNYYTCDSCDEIIPADSRVMAFKNYDCVYCEACYRNHAVKDFFDGEVIPLDRSESLVVIHDESNILEDRKLLIFEYESNEPVYRTIPLHGMHYGKYKILLPIRIAWDRKNNDKALKFFGKIAAWRKLPYISALRLSDMSDAFFETVGMGREQVMKLPEVGVYAVYSDEELQDIFKLAPDWV